MRKVAVRVLAPLCVALTLAACNGDDEGGANAVLAFGAELEGVYELIERDLNLNGCEPIGANVLGHPFLALYTSDEPHAAVKVISCASISGCQAAVRDVRAYRSVSYNFHISFYELEGNTAVTGFETKTLRAGESCQVVVTDSALERTEDMQIEVIAQYWHGDEYPAGAEGLCDEREGPEPALDEPCNEFESMTAERVADLAD